MRAGSLFSGGGGLDLAVEALWPDVEWAWHAETDKAACQVLDARWPDTPNLGDLRDVDWTGLEPVDLLVGGYPCQPWSNAGKRKGADDDRDGWPWFRDAVRHLGPGLVLLENVRGHAVPAGAGRTVGDLSDLGYDAVWSVVRASDVGAPHRRERWFCLAWPTDADRAGWGERRRPEPVRAQQPAAEHVREDARLMPTPAVNDMGEGKTVAWWDEWTEAQRAKHGNGNGHGKSLSVEAQRLMPTPRSSDGPKGSRTAEGAASELARGRNVDLGVAVHMLPTPRATRGGSHTETQSLLPTPKATNNENRQTAGKYGPNLGEEIRSENGARWGDYAPAIARWEHLLGRPAPAPTDDKGRLSPVFVEWLMGWPEGWTDVGLSRSQRLKCLGNGVVPQQAVAAYSLLLDRTEVAA